MKIANYYDEKGVNGPGKDKCTAGWKIKEKNYEFCTNGILLENIKSLLNNRKKLDQWNSKMAGEYLIWLIILYGG
jgi:hypothetical protein